ncbi:MAG: flagellar basal body P-ring formation protein FlgA, partial [Pseudomonadales bacterium]|nr:flagellar basal body P-ring formation protein FlgA [Pseudomonadales bacterium]
PTRASYVPMPSSASEVIGKELTRPVAAGTALSLAMVADPLLVKRGDKVTMVIERGGLKVTMAGKALEDGAVGDKISLSNLVSRRDVMGSVQADGTVRIL